MLNQCLETRTSPSVQNALQNVTEWKICLLGEFHDLTLQQTITV